MGINSDGFRKGLEIIKQFEGLRLMAYPDVKGIWTQGYGRTHGINAYSPQISKKQAQEWLEQDVESAERAIRTYVKVPLSDNQYAALLSLVYNCGGAAVLGTVGKFLAEKNYSKAADAFLLWNKITVVRNGQRVKIVSPGLAARREKERKLFLS